MDRRRFNLSAAALMTGALMPKSAVAQSYNGPNVVLVRFGGGVRRAETIDEATTYAPYLRNVLAKRGVFIPDMQIAQLDGVQTSHAEGTLNILTGRYLSYRDAGSTLLSDRLEPTEPTLFEYLRDGFDLPPHKVLLINGEDRPQEEFFTYGVHDHYGIDYRSEMLSLHRFKLYKFAQILSEGLGTQEEQKFARQQYDALLAADPRAFAPEQSPEVTQFWARWRAHYGDDGFRNPRGDRLLTALALRALDELQPKFMMVNYQDPDYVHWGNPSHYTRAIQVIDEGLQRLVEAVDNNPYYRDNTVFVITPDCGRDNNPLVGLPFQHHFNTKSAHETWSVIFGPGIVKDRTYDKLVDQSAIAPTIAAIMGFNADRAEGDTLSDILI